MVIIAQGCLLSWLRFFGCKSGSTEKERKRDNFWVDRKTCKKKRIATDLYYYYDEIDHKNECMFGNCIQAIYIKGIIENIHSWSPLFI